MIITGPDPHPRSVSARCLVGFWWLFTILMTSTYTANLAAFLTVTIEEIPINSLQELAQSTQLKPLVKRGSNLFTLFKVSIHKSRSAILIGSIVLDARPVDIFGLFTNVMATLFSFSSVIDIRGCLDFDASITESFTLNLSLIHKLSDMLVEQSLLPCSAHPLGIFSLPPILLQNKLSLFFIQISCCHSQYL